MAAATRVASAIVAASCILSEGAAAAVGSAAPAAARATALPLVAPAAVVMGQPARPAPSQRLLVLAAAAAATDADGHTKVQQYQDASAVSPATVVAASEHILSHQCLLVCVAGALSQSWIRLAWQ